MDDLISRQAAIEAVQEALAKMEHSNYFHIWTTTEVRVMVVERILKQLPTAEPRCYLGSPCEYQNAEIRLPTAEPKTGRWIPRDWNETNCKCRTLLYCLPKCSVCGYSADYTNFCPNCGADMRGEQE